jgi:hypothetical protein
MGYHDEISHISGMILVALHIKKYYLSVCMFHKVISALYHINHIPCTDVEFPIGEFIAKQAMEGH